MIRVPWAFCLSSIVMFSSPAFADTPAPLPVATPAPLPAATPAPLPAATPEPLPEGKVPVWKKVPKPRGYVRSEMRLHSPNQGYVYDARSETWIDRGSPYLVFGLLPYDQQEGYIEANVELKYAPNYNFTAYMDVSLLYQTLGPATSDFELAAMRLGVATGNPVELDLTELPQSRLIKWSEERVLIHEAYANAYLGDHVLLLAGKRRTYWGNSFTWTPLDMLNPPKNPMSPSMDREGVYSVMGDLSFDAFTFSLLYAPFELDGPHGLPVNWDFKRGRYIARLYAAPFFQDINVTYVLNDDVYKNHARHRLGFAYSGYPVGSIELHVESALQVGRTHFLVTRRAATGELGEYEAPYSIEQSELDDGRVYGDILIGTRYNFESGSMFLAEYFYKSGGYDSLEYARYREYFTYLEEALPQLEQTIEPLLEAASQGDGDGDGEGNEDTDAVSDSWEQMLANTPYLLQDAYLRRHYLSVSFQKGIINDWLTPTMTMIVALEDGTTILYPQLDMKVSEATVFQTGLMWTLTPEGGQGEIFPDNRMFNARLTSRF